MDIDTQAAAQITRKQDFACTIALWPRESRRQIGRRVNPRLRLRRRGGTLTARFVPRPPHLRAIRFRMGRRTVTDRRAPVC